MDNVAVMVFSGNTAGKAASAEARQGGAACHQVPLPFLSNGEQARIVKVRGKEVLQHHLENLGFVAGAQVKVVSQMSGNMIVEVKGTQVALSQQVAIHVITSVSA